MDHLWLEVQVIENDVAKVWWKDSETGVKTMKKNDQKERHWNNNKQWWYNLVAFFPQELKL